MKSLIRGMALVIVGIAFLSPISLAWADELTSLIQGVKSRYGAIKDMTADFSQETHVKTLGRNQVKSGIVMFKRPDKMRWDFQAPEKQQLLTDGYTLWMYQPEEKVVYMSKLDTLNSAKVPMQILSGELDMKNVFEAKLIETNIGDRTVQLVPRQTGAGYEKVLLHVAVKTHEIKQIDVVDLYGNITKLTLNNVRYNTKLSDAKFVYSPKPGVRVESAPVMD